MSDFTVVNTGGIHRVNVTFCDCPGAVHPREQLLHVAWFPASLERPQTAFSFDVLDSFHLLTLQGKTSAFDYYYSLAHKSDNTELLDIKVCPLLKSIYRI
jgi:hypothetical protein